MAKLCDGGFVRTPDGGLFVARRLQPRLYFLLRMVEPLESLVALGDSVVNTELERVCDVAELEAANFPVVEVDCD